MKRLKVATPPTETYYPPSGFYFSVQTVNTGEDNATSGENDMAFQDASGLSVDIEPESVAEGGLNTYRHRLPVAPKYPDLVLKRGYVTMDSPLFDWCKATIQGGFAYRIKTKTLVLQLLRPHRTTGATEIITQWDFYGAWPMKWSVSEFNSTKNEVVIETLTFAYRYFTAW